VSEALLAEALWPGRVATWRPGGLDEHAAKIAPDTIAMATASITRRRRCPDAFPTLITSIPARCRCEESYAAAHHSGVTRTHPHTRGHAVNRLVGTALVTRPVMSM
jgi:hypothetical protein